jgi:hypothetical protein
MWRPSRTGKIAGLRLCNSCRSFVPVLHCAGRRDLVVAPIFQLALACFLIVPYIDLPRGYVNDELGELVCVARALAFADGHETIMPHAGFWRYDLWISNCNSTRFGLGIAQVVLEPNPLIPTFATQVRCFSPADTLSGVLRFMREHDFSQVIVKGSNGRLTMLTVEGITKWLADDLDGDQHSANKATLECSPS